MLILSVFPNPRYPFSLIGNNVVKYLVFAKILRQYKPRITLGFLAEVQWNIPRITPTITESRSYCKTARATPTVSCQRTKGYMVPLDVSKWQAYVKKMNNAGWIRHRHQWRVESGCDWIASSYSKHKRFKLELIKSTFFYPLSKQIKNFDTRQCTQIRNWDFAEYVKNYVICIMR